MANNRVRINHARAREILQADEVMAALRTEAEKITARTGKPSSYKIEEFVGRNRARVSIWTVTDGARVREATDHTLLRALGGNADG